MSNIERKKCSYPSCDIIPRKGNEWCAKHVYRISCSTCDFIKKDGTRCGRVCTSNDKNLCKNHNHDMTPNKCKYIGQKIGQCNKQCRGDYCGIHNPKSIQCRKDTTRQYMRNERIKQKEMMDKYNELLELHTNNIQD